jgi:hypothetical protein
MSAPDLRSIHEHWGTDCEVCRFSDRRISEEETRMASKQTGRGRKQDRARVAGGQKHEVGYETKKSGKSRAAVKKAVKKVGNSRRKVERALSNNR